MSRQQVFGAGFLFVGSVDASSFLPPAEATNHDRIRRSNGTLEETTAVEVPSSPPRTTLLGTIFSPVFNFFSPAKNGRRRRRRLLS